jgi:hypothetical protein
MTIQSRTPFRGDLSLCIIPPLPDDLGRLLAAPRASMFQPELSETPSCVARQFWIISVHAHICVGPSSSPAARGTHGPLDTRYTGTITRFVLVIAESAHIIICRAESLNLHWTSGASETIICDRFFTPLSTSGSGDHRTIIDHYHNHSIICYRL